MRPPALDQLLSSFDGVVTSGEGWRACCSLHKDKDQSVSIDLFDDGRIMVYCFVCGRENTGEILKKANLTFKDIGSQTNQPWWGREEKGGAGADSTKTAEDWTSLMSKPLSHPELGKQLELLAKTLGPGVLVQSLTAFGVFVGYRGGFPKKNGEMEPPNWCWLEVNGDGQPCGIAKRYQGETTGKKSNKPCDKGSKRGFTVPGKAKQFGGPILWPEGMSDVVAMHSCQIRGRGRPFARCSRKIAEQAARFITKHDSPDDVHIIIGERERSGVGVDGAVEFARDLRQILKRNDIRVVLPPGEYKDYRQYLNAHASFDSTPEHLKEIGQKFIADAVELSLDSTQKTHSIPESDGSVTTITAIPCLPEQSARAIEPIAATEQQRCDLKIMDDAVNHAVEDLAGAMITLLDEHCLSSLARVALAQPGYYEQWMVKMKVAGAKRDDLESLRRAVKATAKKQLEQKKEEDAAREKGVGRDRGGIDNIHRLAREFQLLAPGRLKYFRDAFYTYRGTHWKLEPDHEFRADLNCALERILCRDASQYLQGEQLLPSVTKLMVSNVMEALAGHTKLTDETPWPCWLGGIEPETRNYIALENGLLDVDGFLSGRKDVLLPHSPNWFSTVVLPYPYDPNAKCPRWNDYLATSLEGDPGKISLLREYLGYCLVHGTSLHKSLFMIGEGDNGKSVALAVFSAVIGEANVSAVGLGSFGDRFALSQTLGKLLNVVAEVGELDKVAEDVLKAFVTGDPIAFERKYCDSFVSRPTARILLSTNRLPHISDRSDGVWRRLMLLPFTAKIPKARQVRGMDTPSWWKEQNELSGILNWSLEGLRVLRQRGHFDAPECSAQALEEYRRDSNPARQFLLRYYKAVDNPPKDCGIFKSSLYDRYVMWCKNEGHTRILASNTFGREVKRVFSDVKDGKLAYSPSGAIVEGKAEQRENAYLGIMEVPE